jgi:hypothetical protein
VPPHQRGRCAKRAVAGQARQPGQCAGPLSVHEERGHVEAQHRAVVARDELEHQLERRRRPAAAQPVAVDHEAVAHHLDLGERLLEFGEDIPVRGRAVAVHEPRRREQQAAGVEPRQCPAACRRRPERAQRRGPGEFPVPVARHDEEEVGARHFGKAQLRRHRQAA